MEYGIQDSIGEYQTLVSNAEAYNERHHSQNSCNSYPYDSESIAKIIRKIYKEHTNLLPINRKNLSKLFQLMNLAISPVKLLECSLFVSNKRDP